MNYDYDFCTRSKNGILYFYKDGKRVPSAKVTISADKPCLKKSSITRVAGGIAIYTKNNGKYMLIQKILGLTAPTEEMLCKLITKNFIMDKSIFWAPIGRENDKEEISLAGCRKYLLVAAKNMISTLIKAGLLLEEDKPVMVAKITKYQMSKIGLWINRMRTIIKYMEHYYGDPFPVYYFQEGVYPWGLGIPTIEEAEGEQELSNIKRIMKNLDINLPK